MAKPLISHVGIAVTHLEAAIERYTSLLGEPPHLVKNIPEMGLRVAVFAGGNSAGGHVELLSSTDPDNSIARFIKNRGEGIHHVCINVDNIEQTLAEYKASGYRLIDEVPRVGAMGRRIAFVHPTTALGVLIELEEQVDGD